MSNHEEQPELHLPGYELIEKIGAGGYGEVWSATAPGGLKKAVKFVFGGQFDRRATSELHALEKIKEARHPFLLSLERIEIVEGRVVVVSELADGSLRDRYAECAQEGLPGIPRDELLGYLAEAADALDHLNERHDLAHLDIKPENLLLVSGHVKVADFGLVKSLNNQTQASLVGGMTPTYAAPEVFRGAPSRKSDLYSLAILYQEMLTGIAPFPGVNAAELTLQHLNDDPDLNPLGEGERFAVARALAKDPGNRYESASEFVAALKGVGAGASSFASPPAAATAEPRASFAAPAVPSNRTTELFDDPAADTADGSQGAHRPAPLENPDPVERPAPEFDPAAPFEAAPAVFIGVGGVGARVLRSLRRQVAEHLGATGPLPAAPMLLLDTDSQTLAFATRGGENGIGLDASETVSLPLRRPQAYREKADTLLRWLGRRWLYNIPRSLQTEGIRPLGRLALIDHARQAFQRLRGVLTEALDDGARQATSDATALPFTASGARVYVVGSTAGGAGSGMSIDVAYAVRSILQRLGVEGAKVIGVMTHSTFRDATRSELARVNSYAWLSEFEGFRTSEQGYPGDAGVGLPAHEPGTAAFDHTYFVPLGEQIDTPAFESATDAVAEYLFADAFTPSQRVLDACREATDDGVSTVRSFAVRHRDGQADTALDAGEQAAIGRMIERWIGGEEFSEGPADSSTDQVVHGAVAFLGRTQLESSTLASNCRSLLEASLGGDASAYAGARFDSVNARRVEEVVEAVDRCFGLTRDAGGDPTHVDGKPIEAIIEPITQRLAAEARNWVLSRVNDTQERLDGAENALAWFADYLPAVSADLAKVAASIVSERERWMETAGGKRGVVDADARLKLFRLRLDHAAIAAGRALVSRLHDGLGGLNIELQTLRSVADAVRSELVVAPDAKEADENERLAIAIEQRLQADYLTPHGGLLGALANPEARKELPATIAHATRVITRERELATRAAADAALHAGFADPPIESCGGEHWRLTLRLPSPAGQDAQEEDEVMLVTEMAGASLPHVAAELTGGRRDYAAFAERVRTRRDTDWKDPVVAANTPAPDESPFASAFGADACQPVATAMLD